MLLFVLGIIVGILLLGFVRKNERQVENFVERIVPKLYKEKVEFFPAVSSETEAQKKVLEQNKADNRITALDDL